MPDPLSTSLSEFAASSLLEGHVIETTVIPSTVQPTVPVSSTCLVRALLLVTGLLLGLHLLVVRSLLLGTHVPQQMLFYFDREANAPTYFSSFLLLLAAGLLTLIGFLKRSEKAPLATHWYFLALVFLGLALDEALSLHEMLIEPLRQRFQTSGLLRFPWVVVGAVFVGGIGLMYIPFLLGLARPMQRLFIASAALYITGVVGMEMVGGYYYVGYDDFSAASRPYMVAMTFEELFEMLGIVLFIHTLLAYLQTYRSKLTLSFS